ncbi:MAG TPA: hypothetical protein VHH73_01325 [Verrucomicrobiae bacterium]|nr:hypothetical protein [Verrucomicrobiae bacterium]
MAAQIIITGIGLVLFWWLTTPQELHYYRGWRLALSLLLVWTIAGLWSPSRPTSGMIPGIFLFVMLGFLWSPAISHWTAGGLIRFLYGGGGGGFRADFYFARARAAEGDAEGTVRALREELGKDPLNYEGLMLLASAYQHLQKPDDALAQVDLILGNPGATDAQKEIARAAREEILQQQRHRNAMAGKPVPPVTRPPRVS